MKILLVEDNESIIKGLKFSLEKEYFEVESARRLSEVDINNNYDLVILDIGLPDGNGMSICNYIKENNIPLLFLTAIDDEDTIVRCFELGADDYVIKPFRTRELISRINRILKRENNNILIIKDLKIDLDKNRLYKNDKEIILTALEFKILLMLVNNLDKIITREQIFNKIWDISGNFVNDNTLTVYIKRIRSKIGTDIITTIKGIGYRVNSK